jgi:hypothetical protein
MTIEEIADEVAVPGKELEVMQDMLERGPDAVMADAADLLYALEGNN